MKFGAGFCAGVSFTIFGAIIGAATIIWMVKGPPPVLTGISITVWAALIFTIGCRALDRAEGHR